MNKAKQLTFTGHIQELRFRLMWSVIAIFIATIVAFFLAEPLFTILKLPAGQSHFIFTEVTEMIGTYMKVSLTAGIIASMPFLTYQFIMFVTPALTRQEKKYFYLIIPWIGFMFIAGVIFGYFVLLPPAMKFLLTFGSSIAEPQVRISNYISVVIRLLLAIGLVFELPVITTFLARINVISYRWLADKRKIAILLAFVAGGIITPTFDPINQTLVALPLIVLYEISIWLARLVQKRETKS
jgi:sec-independent protein translocase protein TatC